MACQASIICIDKNDWTSAVFRLSERESSPLFQNYTDTGHWGVTFEYEFINLSVGSGNSNNACRSDTDHGGCR